MFVVCVGTTNMKLQQLQEAKYDEPLNAYVYLECGQEYGESGYDADWCWGFIGRTKAQVGEYEIPEYENPIDEGDAYVHVFDTHGEAMHWAKDRVQLTDDTHDKKLIGSYLEPLTPF